MCIGYCIILITIIMVSCIFFNLKKCTPWSQKNKTEVTMTSTAFCVFASTISNYIKYRIKCFSLLTKNVITQIITLCVIVRSCLNVYRYILHYYAVINAVSCHNGMFYYINYTNQYLTSSRFNLFSVIWVRHYHLNEMQILQILMNFT